MDWEGFSEDQIKLMKGELRDDMTGERQPSTKGQPNKRGYSAKRGRSRQQQKLPTHVQDPSVNPKQMLSQQEVGKENSLEGEIWSQLKEKSSPPKKRLSTKQLKEVEHSEQRHGDIDPVAKIIDIKDETAVEQRELNEEEGQKRELSKLEELQLQQKKMEEENAKKKALLTKAIADRKKQTQEEARRLAYIQKELATIESLLTNDVNILRDKIEEASRLYSDAQKRYQKAEEEFVNAKLNLHHMEEKKEALTEHLCAIIHENELRKAKKLEELVNTLNVDSIDTYKEQLESPQSSNSLTIDSGKMVEKNLAEKNEVKEAVPEINKTGERTGDTVKRKGETVQGSNALVTANKNIEGISEMSNKADKAANVEPDSMLVESDKSKNAAENVPTQIETKELKTEVKLELEGVNP